MKRGCRKQPQFNLLRYSSKVNVIVPLIVIFCLLLELILVIELYKIIKIVFGLDFACSRIFFSCVLVLNANFVLAYFRMYFAYILGLHPDFSLPYDSDKFY